MNAAFFDIDGTLLAKPSLERRLLRDLQRRRAIRPTNYLRWLAEAVRMSAVDPRKAMHGNKTYLRGLAPAELCTGEGADCSAGSVELFPAAVQRVWWHAMRGELIVLVSGTLEPLAKDVKFALERELLWRGVDVNVFVLATQLEVRDGRFTGRVLGAPMFAEEKAQAILRFSRQMGIVLSQCGAYGDSMLDRWMLAAVGHAVAVNPDAKLKTLAHLRGWPTISWTSGRAWNVSVSRLATAGASATWKRRSETAR